MAKNYKATKVRRMGRKLQVLFCFEGPSFGTLCYENNAMQVSQLDQIRQYPNVQNKKNLVTDMAQLILLSQTHG